MARQFKLPIARVERSEEKPLLEAILTVDLFLLSKSKSFAKLKAQAPEWSDQQVIDYLLAMIAEGPV